MKDSEFISKVNEFADLYCPEYMREYSVNVDLTDPDNLTARIRAEDYFGHQWVIPIWVDDNDEVSIPTTAGGSFTLNGEGFYCYLWHEAVFRGSMRTTSVFPNKNEAYC
ncbi:MAG: hypothetical protein DRG82_13615 [Deltaproteobacteria bacterium]|nr:MAG: hypothetical protein DRG82_13615 [Deltaproteobacteria bacterium]